MKESAAQGLGSLVRQAQIITEEMENTLWSKNILGSDTPKKLLNTLVYMFGLHFALRAAQEHRNLRFNNSQITECVDGDGVYYLEYVEDVSKSNQGGIEQ